MLAGAFSGMVGDGFAGTAGGERWLKGRKLDWLARQFSYSLSSGALAVKSRQRRTFKELVVIISLRALEKLK